ncbi:hypothetical protein CEXT_522621 [Caerostris extrusa]|uniref:Uncharacterized protein n=1 Tax=Caerostris extrusa TaxID=172846 RepID=A0AAV4MNK5_CAEEX|nr:hypothetical protein CEXT_522621 [Caerostris extrusa]
MVNFITEESLSGQKQSSKEFNVVLTKYSRAISGKPTHSQRGKFMPTNALLHASPVTDHRRIRKDSRSFWKIMTDGMH